MVSTQTEQPKASPGVAPRPQIRGRASVPTLLQQWPARHAIATHPKGHRPNRAGAHPATSCHPPPLPHFFMVCMCSPRRGSGRVEGAELVVLTSAAAAATGVVSAAAAAAGSSSCSDCRSRGNEESNRRAVMHAACSTTDMKHVAGGKGAWKKQNKHTSSPRAWPSRPEVHTRPRWKGVLEGMNCAPLTAYTLFPTTPFPQALSARRPRAPILPPGTWPL